MDIAKILTPSGVKVLKHFANKSDRYFGNTTAIAKDCNICHVSAHKALHQLAKAGVLRKCPTGKITFYIRSPNSNFLTAFKAMAEMVDEEGHIQ